MFKEISAALLVLLSLSFSTASIASAERLDSNSEIKTLIERAEEARTKNDHQESLKLYLLAAKKGSHDAQNTLGSFYLIGLNGVKKDYKKAREYYEMAIDGGHTKSMNSLGFMYENGRGVVQSYAKAVEYYELAAKNGSLASYAILARLHSSGTHFKKDEHEATRLYPSFRT